MAKTPTQSSPEDQALDTKVAAKKAPAKNKAATGTKAAAAKPAAKKLLLLRVKPPRLTNQRRPKKQKKPLPVVRAKLRASAYLLMWPRKAKST